MPPFMFPNALTPPVITASDVVLSLALGKSTIVNLASDANRVIAGLSAIGGSIDGMVVCFSSVNTVPGRILTFTHNATLVPSWDRFLCSSNTAIVIPPYGAVWFRYSATALGWQSLAKVGTE